MRAIGQFTIGLIVTGLLAIAYANVFAYQWNSLIVPAFDIFSITAAQAYVIMAVKGLLFFKIPTDDEEDFVTVITKSILYGIFICVMSLIFTWAAAAILF